MYEVRFYRVGPACALWASEVVLESKGRPGEVVTMRIAQSIIDAIARGRVIRDGAFGVGT